MATNGHGATILHCAVKHIAIVMYLINECSCNPMATDYCNATVLHYAVQNGSFDAINYLVNTCVIQWLLTKMGLRLFI